MRENTPRPVRVLQYLPSLAKSAGMVNVIVNYYRHMDRTRVHMDFIYLDEVEPSFREELEAMGSSCTHISVRGGASAGDAKLGADATAAGAGAGVDGAGEGAVSVWDFFRNHAGQYDILHCNPIYSPQLFGRVAKRAGIKRIIAHSHSSKFSEKRLSAIRNKALSRFVGFFATDYFTCSDSARVLLGRHGRDAYLVRNAIDCERYAFDEASRKAVRSELGVDDQTLLVGTIGRLSPEKNQAFMLQVANELKRKGHAFKLAVAGDGSLMDELRQRVQSLGLEGTVALLGARSDAERLYSAFDAFLLTSLYEGLPVSAVEAQCSGLPCFISESVTREVALGTAQYLPLDDPAEWADAIIREIQTADRGAKATGCGVKATDGSALAGGRNAAWEKVEAAGFGIAKEAERLQRRYLEIATLGD